MGTASDLKNAVDGNAAYDDSTRCRAVLSHSRGIDQGREGVENADEARPWDKVDDGMTRRTRYSAREMKTRGCYS